MGTVLGCVERTNVTVVKPLTISADSETPGNKTALKPGRSLMDWVKLGHTGTDLTGTGGRVHKWVNFESDAAEMSYGTLGGESVLLSQT
ncbi:Cytochrome b5 reductase 4-like 1 [Homarus americanus]|uniref:Cytochrome b5 reductase 4-like 1 n=1 Tax=Homarus americanus TaxID=6706 RepID=A0A8J5MWD8_HOMAM|nr:Cytochrome b5 reductase 4-like 1 [Homarus americanus]